VPGEDHTSAGRSLFPIALNCTSVTVSKSTNHKEPRP